jgi:hypothetical protein
MELRMPVLEPPVTMSKHQKKGLIISLLFIVVGAAFTRVGLELGHVLWIVLVLFLMVSFIICAVFVVLREMRS